MSLAIDPRHVVEVLLADGWHIVIGNSFGLDAYEYVIPHPDPDCDSFVLLGGGEDRHITSTGFTFAEPTGHCISGPLTAILAVREKDG